MTAESLELRSSTFWIWIGIVAAGALALRLPRLNERPMHGDEAVHAVKFGALLDRGFYHYDPHEYHGPTLYYSTLVSAWLRGERAFADIDETTCRIVPVVYGIALILLLGLVADGLGRVEAVCAGALTAVSPAFVFYSRYFIQEPLLVAFTFLTIGAGWRYARSGRAGWALLCGAGAGLMHASKETCILAFVCMGAALGLASLWTHWREGTGWDFRTRWRRVVVGWAVVVGLAISALFYSSFFTNPHGVADSFQTYANYLKRSGGAGLHDNPWYFYLQMLLYAHYGPGPWWSEAFILVLALAGAVAALTPGAIAPERSPLARFLTFYTILMTAAYSAIPYKTPWCLLSFFHGMILLAGVGAAAIVRRLPGRWLRGAGWALLAAGAGQLAWQSYLGNFVFYADTRNPYVYAHSSNDVRDLAQRVEDIAGVSGEGHDMLIKVITPDYWPIPWYLRRFTRVGYWDEIPESPDAPVIITSPDLEPDLDGRLRDSYDVSYYGLRPEVLVILYVRSDLWDAFIRSVSGAEGVDS